MSETNPTVNRYFVDKSFDHIDHALGRPMFPTKETYRNYYAEGIDSDLAREFRKSPFWSEGKNDGKLAYFFVTDAGRAALAGHIRSLPNQHRAFEVSYNGFSRIVPALTAAKAKYSCFLDISDVYSDLTFSKFTRAATVRKAA